MYTIIIVQRTDAYSSWPIITYTLSILSVLHQLQRLVIIRRLCSNSMNPFSMQNKMKGKKNVIILRNKMRGSNVFNPSLNNSIFFIFSHELVRSFFSDYLGHTNSILQASINALMWPLRPLIAWNKFSVRSILSKRLWYVLFVWICPFNMFVRNLPHIQHSRCGRQLVAM